MVNDSKLKTTPLHSMHQELGGKLVPFAGWHMPIQFKGVIQEHQCVREGVGIFDVSHMGEIEITGPEAKNLVQYLLCDAGLLCFVSYSNLINFCRRYINDPQRGSRFCQKK